MLPSGRARRGNRFEVPTSAMFLRNTVRRQLSATLTPVGIGPVGDVGRRPGRLLWGEGPTGS